MSYYDNFPKYVSVAEKKAKNQKHLQRLMKKDNTIQPIIIEGRTLAKTWWGKAWNKNLDNYADFSNRLSRGRSYVRNGAVLDLKIEKGLVTALVQGSARNPYHVQINIKPLEEKQLEEIVKLCNNQVKDLENLLLGKFPKELSEIFTLKDKGLFPSSQEISFECTCPDWAYMCKHVTAVLCGIGTRFDQDPNLFFTLRNIDFSQFFSKTIEDKLEDLLDKTKKISSRTLDEDSVSELFDL